MLLVYEQVDKKYAHFSRQFWVKLAFLDVWPLRPEKIKIWDLSSQIFQGFKGKIYFTFAWAGYGFVFGYRACLWYWLTWSMQIPYHLHYNHNRIPCTKTGALFACKIMHLLLYFWQKDISPEEQLFLAALQGNHELLCTVLATGKVHVDCKDKVSHGLKGLAELSRRL